MQGEVGLTNVVTYPPGASQTQARIVIDGVRGAIFEYTAGGPAGALASSWASVAGTDSYGNPYPAGFNAGPGSAFSGTNWLANSTGLFFYSPVESAGNLAISISPNGGVGPFGETITPGFKSLAPGSVAFAQLVNQELDLQDSAGNRWDLIAFLSGTVPYLSAGFAGVPVCFISQTGQVVAVQPGTLNPETWHPVTFLNGWTGTLRYKLKATNEVVLSGIITTPTPAPAGTSTVYNVPAGYQPLTTKDGGVLDSTIGADHNAAYDTSFRIAAIPAFTAGHNIVVNLAFPLDV